MPSKNQRVLDVYRSSRRNVKRLHGVGFPHRSSRNHDVTILMLVFFLTLILVGSTLNRIGLHMMAQTIIKEGINYDYFREMLIPIDSKLFKEFKLGNDLEEEVYDSIVLNTLLTQNEYAKVVKVSQSNRRELLKDLSKENYFKELKGYYYGILGDVGQFPVDLKLLEESEVNYSDSWNYLRSYGGKRKHEGTDIMSGDNLPNEIKVLSMTNGTVEKMGWLEQGGYRVGIRGNKGVYFYYAHLSSYAPLLKVGDVVKVGDFIGYMGDSGYGTEGTTGQFPVHLHVGIYVETPFGELSVNPYRVLKLLEMK